MNFARNFWRHIPEVVITSYLSEDGQECEIACIPEGTFKSVDNFIIYIKERNYEIISIKQLENKTTVVNYILPEEPEVEED